MKKKLLTVLLSVCMVTTIFTGCGKGAAADTYEYIGEYSEFGDFGDNKNLNNAYIDDGYVYYTMYTYSNTESEDVELYGEAAVISDKMVSESIDVDEDNSSTFSLVARNMETGEENAFDLDMDQNTYVNCMDVCGENILLCMSSWDEKTERNLYTLDLYSREGEKKDSIDVSKFLDDSNEYVYINTVAIDEEGNMYFTDGNQSMYVLDGNSHDLKSKEDLGYVNTISSAGAGVWVMSYTGEDWVNTLSYYEAGKGEVTKEYKDMPNDIYRMVVGDDNKVYFNSGNNLYGFNEDTGEVEEILNWIGVDVDGNQVQAFTVLEDGRIYLIMVDWGENYAVRECYLTKTKVTADEARTKLTLSVFYLDYNARQKVLDFNRNNKEYRVEVKDYSQYDYEEAIAKMQADISGSECPDIVDASFIDARTLGAQGYLTDLTPYFEKDFSREDYLENVLEAGKVGDKQYVLPSSFMISTTMAKGKAVNGKQDWTTAEFRDFIVNRPKDTNVFMYYTKENILRSFLQADMNEFIDWETGNCNFDSDEFKSILEMCNTFPDEIDWEAIDDEYMSYPNMIKNGKLALTDLTIYEVYELQEYAAMADGDAIFVGYPVNGTCSPVLRCSENLYAISSQCKDKEGAWQFVKTFFEDDYQKDISYGFPVKKTAFEKKIEYAATPEYSKDENGKEIELPKTSVGWDDWEMDIYAATDEEIALFRNLVDRSKGSVYQDTELINMIYEEAQPYFQKQKSVDEVAKIIQSRISIYVGEML